MDLSRELVNTAWFTTLDVALIELDPGEVYHELAAVVQGPGCCGSTNGTPGSSVALGEDGGTAPRHLAVAR